MQSRIGNPRNIVLDRLVDSMLSIRADHPTRVAVDGRSAAGKTTLADDLAAVIRSRGRDAIRSSIDDFYRPGHKNRSERGEWTPQSRYDEGYDYQAFINLVLRPLGPGGTRRCRTSMFDSYHDVWLPEEWIEVGADTVAVIDGIFLLRPELAVHWDYILWLDIDMETMVNRARQRDVAWTASEQLVVERYRNLWIPTHELYERIEEPAIRARAIIDNRNVSNPKIVKLVQSHVD